MQPWPGNVRELRNTVARQLALGDLRLSHDDPHVTAAPAPGSSADDFLDSVVATRVPLVREPLLVLTPAADATPDRHLLYVTGGLLARAGQRGRFELRQALDGRTLLTAIHEPLEPRG